MFWQGQANLDVGAWILRALVTFLWLLFLTKLMGQRQIGRLTLFDFVIAITIGSVSASPLSDSATGLSGAFITIGTIAALDIIIAYAALKFSKLRRVVQDEPLVLIQNGQLLEDTMRKARFNLGDLLAELRLKKIANLHDVEFAILEHNGKVSVIPKSQKRPLTPADLKISTTYEGMPTVIIEDGNVLEDNLRENNLDRDWLNSELERFGITDPQEVMAAQLDTRGRLYVSLKGQDNDQFWH